MQSDNHLIINKQLMEAVIDGNLRMIKLLLNDYNADINYRDELGQNPLLFAAKINNLEIFTFLIEEGANVSATDNIGLSPLDWAERNSNEDMISMISESLSNASVKKR